jgi:hypothetical protein
MADNQDIAIKVKVEGVDQSIESVKDLKNAIKAAKDEQVKAAAVFGESSKEFIDASKKVSQLKDKVEDLADSTKSLKGSGVERASEGFNQLGEGLRNLDFEKVKVGLIAMKSALAAVGIGLIVQAVTYLIENFNELSQGSGILAKTLQKVGEILGGVVEALYGITDAIGATNHQLDLMGDKITENVEKFKESLDIQVKGYDRQIALLKALGKETIEVELEKQRQIIFTNTILIKQIESYVRQGGELNDEKKKQLATSLEANKDAWNQMKLIEINNINEQRNANKKANDEKLVDNKKYSEDLKKLQEQRFNEYIKSQEDELAVLKKRLEDEKLILEQQRLDEITSDELKRQKKSEKQLQDAELNALNNKNDIDSQIALLEAKRQVEIQSALENGDSIALINKKYADEEDKLREEQSAKDKAARQQKIDNTIATTQQGLQATQQLTDVFFAYQLEKNKGNAKAELEIRKKQFNVNKAFGITNAVIDGIGAVQKALNNPYPLNIVLAAISGIAAAANIAKIASTKFDGGAASGGGGASAPTSVPVPAAPTINTPQNNTNSSTTFDETGKKIGGDKTINPTIQVHSTVGVNEIADKSNRVNVLEQQSKF